MGYASLGKKSTVILERDKALRSLQKHDSMYPIA